MIKWCSYCQSYLGEYPPAEIYDFSHGICENCKALGLIGNEEVVTKMKTIAQFYYDLRKSGFEGDLVQAKALVERAEELKVHPTDLCIGILQPILYEIGQRWRQGVLTVAEEHRFTSTCQSVLEFLYEKFISPEFASEEDPQVLLFVAEDNFHVLGVRILDFFLKFNRIRSRVVVPGLPFLEAVLLTKKTKPKVVGFSVGDESQFRMILNYLEKLKAVSDERFEIPLVVAGGFPIRDGCWPKELSEIVFIQDPKSFLDWYRQIFSNR